MQHTTKRINPVTGQRYEAPRLLDQIARELAAQLASPFPLAGPATLPGVGVGQPNS